MPNWCASRLELRGPEQSLLAFKEAAKGRCPWSSPTSPPMAFSLSSFVPVPQYVLDAGYNDVGYNWNTRHWGTKWNLSEDGVEVTGPTVHPTPVAPTTSENMAATMTTLASCIPLADTEGLVLEHISGSAITLPKDHLTYRLSTAWSPPSDEVLLAASRRFPDLRIEMRAAERATWGVVSELS